MNLIALSVRTVTILAATAFLLVPGLNAQERRTDKSRLTIMTFNAEFMWDGVAPEQGNVEFRLDGIEV